MASDDTKWESGCVLWWNYSNDSGDSVEIRSSSGDDGNYGARNLPYAIARAAVAAGHGNAPWSPLDLLFEAVSNLEMGEELAKRAGPGGIEAWAAIQAWNDARVAELLRDGASPNAKY